MIPEKMYEHLVAMIYEHDPDLATHIVTHPFEYCDSSWPFYSAAANLLIDCRIRMDKAQSSATTVSAVKRICKEAMASVKPSLHGMFYQAGYYVICDGYRILRLKDELMCLPHLDPKATPPDCDKIIKAELPYATLELQLPDMADLKCYLARWRATLGKNNPIALALLPEELFVNPQYLLDMMQALPGARAYVNPDRLGKGMIYFKADNGDGVLLPVNPNGARTL